MANVNKLTYVGNLDPLAKAQTGLRHRHFKVANCEATAVAQKFREVRPDSHGNRSIDGAAPFVTANVEGADVLLNTSLAH